MIEIFLELACIICLETEDKRFMTSRCGHVACEECWQAWLKQKPQCPQCKKTVKLKQLIRLHV